MSVLYGAETYTPGQIKIKYLERFENFLEQDVESGEIMKTIRYSYDNKKVKREIVKVYTET